MLNSFFIFDAARATEENLAKSSGMNENRLSLYRGKNEQVLAGVAPYIFSFPHSKEFSDFILQNGWGDSWGIFVITSRKQEELFDHFSKLLTVNTEDGEEFYFRFYDPRVLRMFLPTCTVQQLKEFFGPVEKIICGDKEASFALQFSFDGNKLATERMPADLAFTAISDPTPSQARVAANESNTGSQGHKPRRRFLD